MERTRSAPARKMAAPRLRPAPAPLPRRQPGAAGTQTASVPKNSRDPFKIEWHKMPPPPYVFSDPNIQPLRVASADVEVPPVGDVTVREVADRRVSGIMSGDGVFAILESPGGDPEIVKPGSQTRDGYRVVSISADSLKLQRKDGNIVRTQVVPLTDQGVGGQQMAGGGMFGGGGGGMRGGMPGSGGMPFPGGMPGSGGRQTGTPWQAWSGRQIQWRTCWRRLVSFENCEDFGAKQAVFAPKSGRKRENVMKLGIINRLCRVM